MHTKHEEEHLNIPFLLKHKNHAPKPEIFRKEEKEIPKENAIPEKRTTPLSIDDKAKSIYRKEGNI